LLFWRLLFWRLVVVDEMKFFLVLVFVLLGVSKGDVEIPATDSSLHYIGRYAFNFNNQAGFDWSGFSIKTQVCGATLVSLQIEDAYAMYYVYIDGFYSQTIHVNPNPDAAISLPDKNCHNMTITKITEAANNFNSVSLFSGIVTNAASLEAHRGFTRKVEGAKKNRKLVFVGDGMTCGYGVLSNVTDCVSPTADYGKEDVTHSYVGYISTAFDAVSQVLCYTGKGVVHNKNDPNVMSDQPMPVFWNRTMALINNIYYDFSQFSASAVYINLGTNDFATAPYPTADQFEDGYKGFIKTVKNSYPDVPIFIACGPMADSSTCSYVKQVAKDEGAAFILMDQSLLTEEDEGCDYFPNTSGSQKIADASIPVMAGVLGW